jgi:hypothetical protein
MQMRCKDKLQIMLQFKKCYKKKLEPTWSLINDFSFYLVLRYKTLNGFEH